MGFTIKPEHQENRLSIYIIFLKLNYDWDSHFKTLCLCLKMILACTSVNQRKNRKLKESRKKKMITKEVNEI